MIFSNKDLKKLIIPLMGEQLLSLTVGFVDQLMVSQTGEAAVAGVALVDNINRLIIQIMAALATGGAVVCSQYIGAGRDKQTKKAAGQLELVLFTFAFIMMGISVLFARPLLSGIFGNTQKAIMDFAVLYFTVTAISYPFLGIYNSGAAIFRSVGNSKISLYISLLMNVVNILGNAIFVLCFKWGVFGVALSTLISRVIGSGVMSYFIMRKQSPIRLNQIADYIPDFSLIKKILFIGIPSGVENGMFQIGKLMVVRMVTSLGQASIAANSVSYTIIDFANIPASSMGLALITVVGQCIGAGKKDEAKHYVKKILLWSYIGDWICNITLFFIGHYIPTWFNLSPEAVDIATVVLRAFNITSLFIWPLSFTMPNALRAAGDVHYTMIVSILSMWIFRVGSSYVFGIILGFGVLGVWIGMFVDWACRSAFFTIRFLNGKWIQKKSLVN
ncbi:MATE family efflux transporter [Lachnospira multipara]|uniref:MATE family efflux transporter n=1 Tax=Lachnospira multipara TaxID=28051 RepID=UPI0004E14A0A|nr:MATE family efflux transporter [Lachnospira multipara]